jgi:hypothetical protein
MENTEEIEGRPALIVGEEMQSCLYEIAKWANLLAIVGFVVAGIMVVFAFIVGSTIGQDSNVATKIGGFGAFAITIIFLVCAFTIFYPSLLLIKYSSKAKYGVLNSDQSSLDEALLKLRSVFKYWGITTIIMICIYIVLIISTVMNYMSS